MLKRNVILTAIASMLTVSIASSAAFAQMPPRHGGPPPPYAHPHQPPPPSYRPPPPHYRPPPPPPPHYRPAPPPRHMTRDVPRWNKGHRLPPHFYQRGQVIHRYKAHRLPPPPRGHEWVRVGNDAVMVAIGTGMVIYGLSHIFR